MNFNELYYRDKRTNGTTMLLKSLIRLDINVFRTCYDRRCVKHRSEHCVFPLFFFIYSILFILPHRIASRTMHGSELGFHTDVVAQIKWCPISNIMASSQTGRVKKYRFFAPIDSSLEKVFSQRNNLL